MHEFPISLTRVDTYAILYLDHSHLKPRNVIGQQQGSENS